MKAFILAAGLGTRLQSLGLTVPKVMVPIGGRSLLEHHVVLCKRHGLRDLIVNLHHLPDAITSHFGDGRQFGVRMTYSFEPTLLGTAGAVRRMAHELRGGTFLVFYGDNLVDIELAPLLEFHRVRQAVATIALFESPEPWTGGVVRTDETGRVIDFVEKPNPRDVTTNLINAGIYVLEPSVLDAIPPERPSDFGHDVFPKLLSEGQRVFAMRPRAYVQDIGTPEGLAKAQRDFAQGLIVR